MGSLGRQCPLIGDPGTGRLCLRRAIAGTRVSLSLARRSNLLEMFVGVAPAVWFVFRMHVRRPLLIFIDEIDVPDASATQ